VPQQSSLDVVELHLSNDDVPHNSVTVAVRIRSQSVHGPVLGTSAEVTMPYPTAPSTQHFDFSSSVPLVPGELYVWEVFVTSGSGNATISGIDNVYPQGRAIACSDPASFNDWWFREGTTSPVSVPGSVESTSWAAIKGFYR
jgi:hypothetical protein